MSEGNVEVVRRAYQRFNAGDVESFVTLCSPNLVFRDLPDLPGSGLFEGREGFRTWWSQLTDAFDDLRFDPGEILDAGEKVFAEVHAAGLGKGSGAVVEMSFFNVWTLRDGEVVSIGTYRNRGEALSVAALEG